MKLIFLIITFVFVTSASRATFAQGTAAPAKTIKVDGSAYELVFFDDFENGLENWRTTDEAAWSIITSEKTRSFGLNRRVSDYTPKYRSPHNIALLKEKSFENVVIEMDVRSMKDTGDHRDCCIFFGYQDANNFYYAHLGARPDAASGQIMLVKNAPRKPLTKNKNRVGWTDQWHHVRLVHHAKSGAISVYFDDFSKPLMQVSDNTFRRGMVGIGSFDDMNEFDNFRVYRLSK